MEFEVTYIWLIAGAIAIMLEASGASGIGLFFAGIGAFCVAVGLSTGLIPLDAHLAQWTVFFISTALAAIILWKPLQKVMKGVAQGYSDVIGKSATVKGVLTKGAVGNVTWSGTIMHAKLIPDSIVDELPNNAEVIIVAVDGATLIVKPK